MSVDGVTASVIGPRTLVHLEDLLEATELELSNEDRLALEEPAPPPEVSPHRTLRGQ
jgi:aryl-alcohol dehydrogenase-like predicted oxidoreductase